MKRFLFLLVLVTSPSFSQGLLDLIKKDTAQTSLDFLDSKEESDNLEFMANESETSFQANDMDPSGISSLEKNLILDDAFFWDQSEVIQDEFAVTNPLDKRSSDSDFSSNSDLEFDGEPERSEEEVSLSSVDF